MAVKFIGLCSIHGETEKYISSGQCCLCSRARTAKILQERKEEYARNRAVKFLLDPEYQDHRRKQKRDAERARRQRSDVKAVRRAERMRRIADTLQRTPAWADHEKIKAFYRLATAFSDLYIEHHVDHIVPLKGETVSGLHVENNLQVLVGVENLRKSNRLLAA